MGSEARAAVLSPLAPAESLDAMAARMEGRFRGAQEKLQEARARLERAIQAYRPKGTASNSGSVATRHTSE